MFIQKLLFALFIIIPLNTAFADTDVDTVNVTTAPEISENDIIPVEELLAREPDATECATAIFADALAKQIADVPEDTPESDVATLIHVVFSHGPTLEQVIACPEIANADEMDDIKFMPIKYTFPGGREIVINYETQPKILKQRLTLANKTPIPASDASPRLGDLNDPSIWTNTDPAWYGIIITEAGALNQFVGDGKNNTISLRYIEENIDSLKPHNGACYSESALANDNKIINLTGDRTTGDDQDYYISGDVNLQWISYLEIGLDVVITVATFGGGAVISGATKAARAAKVMRNLSTGMRALAKTKSVTNYIKLSQKYTKMTKKIAQLKKLHNAKTVDKYIETNNRMRKLLRERNALSASDPKYAKTSENYLKAMDEWNDLMRQNPNLGREIANVSDADDIAKAMRDLEKADKNVRQYKESAKAFSDLQKYRHQLQLLRRPAKRGNVATRKLEQFKKTFKSFQAANTGGKKISKANDIARNTIKQVRKEISTLEKEAKTLSKAEKTADNVKRLQTITKEIQLLRTAIGTATKPTTILGKVGAKTARLRDWLFHSSMKNIGKLGRMEEKVGFLYGALKFAGDMYDWSETSTGDYTSGIEFKPLLLLSADDIEGQENVVNHGMWLLWQGDTYSATDDDAAYLQAMDFAEKFYRDLLDIQQERNDYSCNNIDIYVVRPIIRNPGDDNAELYYLIMNDIPWTTSGH